MNEALETAPLAPLEAVSAFIVSLPLVKPFETSFSVKTVKEALLLRVRSSDGEGWGECVAFSDPFYSYETNATALHILKEFLLPAAAEGGSLRDVLGRFQRVRGHNMAKAAVENAFLDLIARREGLPLWKLLGGSEKRIPSGLSIGIKKSPEDLAASVGKAVEKKYGRIKVKIKRGKDAAFIRAVREAFPNVRLMADANADYSLEDLPALQALDAFGLMMIEQPLSNDDIYQHSLLQKRLKTALCLDESIHSLDDARTAFELGSCRIINIKQGRVGGLLASKSMAAFCLEKGMPVWSGGMLETGIGRAANLHLQTLPGFVLPGDTSETANYFCSDIVDKPVVLDPDGMIRLPEGDGLGVSVVPGALARHKTFEEIIYRR
jgi:O-succinylbenzoate synthase